MNQRKSVVLCLVIITLAVTAACSNPSPESAKTAAAATGTSASPVSSTVGQAQQAALAAYTGMWADYADAARTADYKDQQLTRHAANAALSAMVQSLYALQRQGLVIRGTLTTNPTIADMIPADAPTQIDIKDCASDIDWLQYVAATGKPKDAARGGHRIITARVTKQYDLWRVANYQVQPEGSC